MDKVTTHDTAQTAEKGYIYVATVDKLFYEMAILAAESLKTMHRKAHVTLFTNECFVDNRAYELFDNIVVNIPAHPRAKMWCMAKTPYQKTFYCDVDSQVVHPNIKKVFDPLDNCDMYFTKSIWHTVADRRWAYIDKDQQIPVQYHGAVCCYNKNDLTLDFHQTWFNEFVKQRQNPWVYDFAYKNWQQFDMFTLWRMTNSDRYPEFKRFEDLNIILGPKQYNATIHDGVDKYNGSPPVVYQIDKHTMEQKMPSYWQQIQKGLNDERSFPKQLAPTKDTFHYL